MGNDYKKLFKALEEQGWRCRTLKSGHTMWFSPDGESKVTISGTPSSHRALTETIKGLRRGGFTWPPPR